MQLTNNEVLVIQSFLKKSHFPCPVTGENCRHTTRFYTEWCGAEFPTTIEQIDQRILDWWPTSGIPLPSYYEVEEVPTVPELVEQHDNVEVKVETPKPKVGSDMIVTVGGVSAVPKSDTIGGVKKRKRRAK